VNNVMCAVTRPLTVPSGNLDSSAIRQRVQEPGQLQSYVLSSGVTGGEESNLKSTVTSEAQYLPQGVNETPSFPLLQSIAEGLRFILDNCEV